MTVRMGRATPLKDVTEKQWDAQLFGAKDGLAKTLGWSPTLCYHTLRSKGSRSGFPDRVLVRDRVIYAELKRETGTPTDTQIEWLTGLATAGAEVYLWRPSDLDEIARVLSKRWTYAAAVPSLWTNSHDAWSPRTLWLPAGHRNDENVQEVIAA